jgi:hypothetical protein
MLLMVLTKRFGEAMKQGGRPRRSEEQPDSPFGVLLKEHLRRVSNFTQVELCRETLIAEKTLSNMIKGTRSTRGNAFRRDLRAIVKALYDRQALQSLAEANRLFTANPTIKELDARDAEDAAMIDLLPPAVPPPPAAPDPSPGTPPTVPPSLTTLPSQTKSSFSPRRTGWMILIVVVCLVFLGGLISSLLLITHIPPQTTSSTASSPTISGPGCANATNGVILYTDLNYQGQCHVFPPGSYELAQFGLEENVSSLKDPKNAYHVTLWNKAKNLAHFDTNVPALPPEWDNAADTMLVEKHRPTTCQPGANGIAAYIDTNYANGCLFITKDIPDLTPLDFDQIITSLRFLGSYRNTHQLVLYKRTNYQEKCGAYWQDQPDLLQCARNALSVRVLPFTATALIPMVPGISSNLQYRAIRFFFSGNFLVTIDDYQQTVWIREHQRGPDRN